MPYVLHYTMIHIDIRICSKCISMVSTYIRMPLKLYSHAFKIYSHTYKINMYDCKMQSYTSRTHLHTTEVH